MALSASIRSIFRHIILMGRLALGCFEDRPNGGWVCIRVTTVTGPAGPVIVQKGRAFAPKTTFGR